MTHQPQLLQQRPLPCLLPQQLLLLGEQLLQQLQCQLLPLPPCLMWPAESRQIVVHLRNLVNAVM